MKDNPPVLCLMGPTATGKTDLALKLVEHFPQLDLVSVDSAMVYRGLDIGTAKPSHTILEKTPHRLIDIRDPSEIYSAADFCLDAKREIHSILQRGRVPLLVGGTMLYFRSLQCGLSPLPSADQTVRNQLSARAEKEGWPKLHSELAKIDPLAASRIHPHDAQRLQRALEVYQLTGSPLSSLQAHTENSIPFNFINLILMPASRPLLHDNIAKRFHHMLEQGFLEEVQQLFKRDDLDLTKPALRAVGYRQAWRYLQREYSESHFHEKAIAATRQLAKRQITWLRTWSNANYFEVGNNSEDLIKHISLFLIQSASVN